MSTLQEYALADRLRELVRFVDGQGENCADDVTALATAYLLTRKQCDDVDRICHENNWAPLNCYAVMVGPDDIRHVLNARRNKDGLSCAQVAEIIAKAYSPRSLIRRNPPARSGGAARKSEQQSVMLNTHQKLNIGGTLYYATAILEIRIAGSRRYLAPVTCYHATEAKKRRILK